MTHKVVAGVFASPEDAARARTCLVEAGVADGCIGLSTDLTADGIAAEAPGQSYSNQPGQFGEVDPTEPYADAARVGPYVLRVDLVTGNDDAWIDRIMRRCGAQQTTHCHG